MWKCEKTEPKEKNNISCQMTDRMNRLRERYLQSPVARREAIPHSYGNHPVTIHWLEGYLEARKISPTTFMRRSYAEVAELQRSKCVITEEELLVGQPDFEAFYTERERFEQLMDKYQMAADVSPDGRSDHLALDYRKLLKVGVRGLIEEIETEKNKLTFAREEIAENIAKEEFYEACLMELKALLEYAHRYEGELRRLAETAEPARREELLSMADNMARVPEYPAETFWQALQSIHFYTFTLRGLYAAGRPDQYLLPYYEADTAAGRLTQEFAGELIENFCMLYATYIYPNTAVGMMVGGTDEDGNLVENPLTWAFLKAVDHINMPDPNIGLCVTEKTGEDLLRYAFDMIGRGNTFPSFWNDREVVRSLTAFGFNEKDAHNYINSTCVEVTIIGKSAMWTTSPYHNLAELLLEVFEGEEFQDFESFKRAYFKLISNRISEENHRMNILKLERSRNASEAMRHSCLIDDCIGRGKPVGQGGAVYGATLPNFLGFANAIDALYAIRELVYVRKELTMETYRQAVQADFEGYAELRGRLLYKLPHYGNDNPDVDEIAVELADCIRDSCKGLYTLHGDIVIPGIFSYNYHVLYGKRTRTTPDGRLSGTPLADSCGPAQGRDVSSPTASLRSGTCWPQGEFLGGVAQNIHLSKRYFEQENMQIPIALLRGFFKRGGCELQFNCIDGAVMEDAVLHPEEHRDLLVRVGGYSDYFTRLSAGLQKEIIERTRY